MKPALSLLPLIPGLLLQRALGAIEKISRQWAYLIDAP
ncbi:MAG: hypothetical protein JWM59_4424 [Verrucomicrobiales bacterium]|nr:hypothetical protein [Verrucomicrobiales bacterium]